MADAPQVYLVRHGETEWTLTGQHTGGGTDIPLTDKGREQARQLRAGLAGHPFALVLSSPLSRALDTARLAGFGDQVEATEDLLEWDYGEYDGRTTADIRQDRLRWSLWTDGAPGGETAAEVGIRVDRIIKEIHEVEGDVLLFGHGHSLRVLTARWLALPASEGRLFALDPATVSILSHERENPVIRRWNDDNGVQADHGIQATQVTQADHGVQATQADHGVQATQADHGVQATQADHGVQATQADHGVQATQAGPPQLL